MHLTNDQKTDLRYKIKRLLESDEVKERIKIDKELLEQLIFDEGNYKGARCKVVAWSGSFLSKIDLSEIDFNNVLWRGEYVVDKKDNYVVKSDVLPIILDNTNAKIDFSKSAKLDKEELEKNTISNCSFKSMDLFYSNIECFEFYNNCDFSDSKFIFDLKRFHKYFLNCKFLRSNILDSNIYSHDLVEMFNNCNFSDSNLSIIHILKKNYKNDTILVDENDNEFNLYDVADKVEEMRQDKLLDNCRINGWKYFDDEQLYYVASDKETTKYTDSILDDMIHQIEYEKRI